MKKYIALLMLIVSITGIISFSNSAVAATNENILIVFDASGSMTESFGGSPRIDVAKSAITDLLASLDANTSVGLRAFAQEKITAKASACVKTDLLQSFTTDRNAITTQVDSLQAVGSYTPLAYTLQQSAGDFTVGADNVLILMTDGQENCGGNPADAAAALKAAGIKVKTYVIGLGADTTTRAQLSGIATAGGGTYYDATDATSLAASFNAIQQAEHPVDKTNTDSMLGKEVTGGNGYSTAVPITPGMYHLSHYQLGSQYDYFKMDVKEGDVIKYSIQSSESMPKYIEATNSFEDGNNHSGSYAGMKIHSATRAQIGWLYEGQASQVRSDSLTIDDTNAGTIYFLVGNDNSKSQVMSKSDIFTIKVSSPSAVVTSTATNPMNGTVPVDTNNLGTASQQPGQNYPSVDSISQTVNSITSNASNIFYTILWTIVGAVVFFIVIVALIIYLVVKHNKKGSLTTNPVMPSVQQPVPPIVPTPASSPVTTIPPIPPVPPVIPQA